MENITSINNEYIKYLNSLHQKKNRTLFKEFIIEGKHLVDEAKKAKRLSVVLSNDEALLKEYDARQILVTEQIISKLSTTMTPQNILGVVKMKEQTFPTGDCFVLLDNVNDPGNLGTIIRTSIALGVTNILLSSDSVDPFNEKTIRATQGTIFKAHIYVDDLKKIYDLLKKENVQIITTDLKAQKTLDELKVEKKYCLVLGNEANGVSDLSKQMADEAIIIPLQNDVESLNVSIAHSIILYQLQKA